MTIAASYLSPEGVVLGADSTTTMWVSCPDGLTGGFHYLNYAQKLFEVGESSTIGVTMWGMGAVGNLSHRTLIACFADDLAANPPSSMQDAANRYAAHFWSEYSAQCSHQLRRVQELTAKMRTPDEDQQLRWLLDTFAGGHCFGGYLPSDPVAQAYEIQYSPQLTSPLVKPLAAGAGAFWGCPNMIERLLFGWDQPLFDSVFRSEKWTGTEQELFDLIWAQRVAPPTDLPLREAIDWVHTAIYTTIKSMKFSHFEPVCGGPIEIAVISTDRRFRWVTHKRFDEALP